MMKILTPTAAAAAALALAACGDNRTDDVVQMPSEGAQPLEVTNEQADRATSQTAMALGMTHDQLEDANLVTADNTKLGDVDTLVMDASGTVTHLVIDLEDTEDVKVQVPVDQVRAVPDATGATRNLTTDMTAAQLTSLPRWNPMPQ